MYYKGDAEMSVQKPDSMQEMVDQVWYAMIGMNGDGLISRVIKLDDRLDRIEVLLPQLVTKERCVANHEEHHDRIKEQHKQKDEHLKYWIALIITNLATIACGIMYIIK